MTPRSKSQCSFLYLGSRAHCFLSKKALLGERAGLVPSFMQKLCEEVSRWVGTEVSSCCEDSGLLLLSFSWETPIGDLRGRKDACLEPHLGYTFGTWALQLSTKVPSKRVLKTACAKDAWKQTPTCSGTELSVIYYCSPSLYSLDLCHSILGIKPSENYTIKILTKSLIKLVAINF